MFTFHACWFYILCTAWICQPSLYSPKDYSPYICVLCSSEKCSIHGGKALKTTTTLVSNPWNSNLLGQLQNTPELGALLSFSERTGTSQPASPWDKYRIVMRMTYAPRILERNKNKTKMIMSQKPKTLFSILSGCICEHTHTHIKSIHSHTIRHVHTHAYKHMSTHTYTMHTNTHVYTV